MLGSPATDSAWAVWFERWSLPLADITTSSSTRSSTTSAATTSLANARELATSSIKHTRAVARAVFTHVHKRRLLEWDPWDAVEAEPDTVDGIDPDLVLPPDPRPVYVAAIERNVLAELRANQSFGVADRLDRVLSDEIRGLAGPSEVLRALQGLHRTGRIGGDPPKSKALEDYIVTRGPRFG